MRAPGLPRCGPGFLALVLAGVAGCSAGPTERDITDSLNEELRSVVGEWTGASVGADQGAVTLNFRLEAGSGTAVAGTGAMQERGGATLVPITVTGSFARPVLTLTFDGMTFEGRAVQGTFTGRYTTVGGISDALVLSAPGYTRTIPMLLQEQ